MDTPSSNWDLRKAGFHTHGSRRVNFSNCEVIAKKVLGKLKDLFEEEEENYPRLIEKRPISYPVTLLCVLLRKRLLEADAAGGETRVILNRDQIIDMLKIFLPESTNETRIIANIDSYINKVIDYGFLRQMKSSEDQDVYEINRVLIARIRADELQYLEGKLKEHARSIA